MFPVFILTKGRAEIATTPSVLEADNVPYALVVEPQEAEVYRLNYPRAEIVVLPKDNQGLAYACYWLVEYVRSNSLTWFWRMDDNLGKFGETRCRRVCNMPAGAILSRAELATEWSNRLGLVGLQYTQYAWAARKQYTINRMAAACYLQNAASGIQYDLGLPAKQDVDLTLRHVTQGWYTLIWQTLSMSKPTIASWTRGGQCEMYNKRKDWDDARRLRVLWPQYVKLVMKRGRLDVKIDWAKIDALWAQHGVVY